MTPVLSKLVTGGQRVLFVWTGNRVRKEEEIKKRSMKERPLKNGGLKRPLAVEVTGICAG